MIQVFGILFHPIFSVRCARKRRGKLGDCSLFKRHSGGSQRPSRRLGIPSKWWFSKGIYPKIPLHSDLSNSQNLGWLSYVGEEMLPSDVGHFLFSESLHEPNRISSNVIPQKKNRQTVKPLKKEAKTKRESRFSITILQGLGEPLKWNMESVCKGPGKGAKRDRSWKSSWQVPTGSILWRYICLYSYEKTGVKE